MKWLAALASLSFMPVTSAWADGDGTGLEASYRFLVSERAGAGGVLQAPAAGVLKNSRLPLSFVDDAGYWGEYVCALAGNSCAVTDVYNPVDYSLNPLPGTAAALQIERVDVHNGTNIYDAATWQIAVVLGALDNPDAYALASDENRLLSQGYAGKSELRATTRGPAFLYNGVKITDPRAAFAYRMLAATWLNTDPLMGTRFAALVSAKALPAGNPDYRAGMISWSDWKPVTGENAWALLLGPLQAAWLHYQRGGHQRFVPYSELAVQNALGVLPAFAAMQSALGGVYYAPAGTLANQGNTLIDPRTVSVENNLSLYAGLRILQRTLQAELDYETDLQPTGRATIELALSTLSTMLSGGATAPGYQTRGLLVFFKSSAWLAGGFVRGGRANVPGAATAWMPMPEPKAVDVNTWGIAALGAAQLDKWFGFAAAFDAWQSVKQWGGYGVGTTLWGVGYSDQDGNGRLADGGYRQGVLSSEWTAGAITAVRNMIHHYDSLAPASPDYAQAQLMLRSLHEDERAMLVGMQRLRVDRYASTAFSGKVPSPVSSGGTTVLPYLYASRRHFIPFGWYANPLPSTCSTAWAIMVADWFDPFGYGGEPN